MTKLSIITINLNNKVGLQKTISSLIGQTFADCEYIVIDGGSSDGSIDVIKKYANRISYWVSEPDQGIYNAMNKGISVANGELICFLNSGDEYNSTQSINEVINKIRTYPHYCWIYIFDYIYANSNGSKTLVSSKDVTNKVRIFAKGFGHPSTFYRKELFKKIGLFDESYKISADRELYMRAILKYNLPFKYFAFPVSVFNEGGISTNTNWHALMLNEDKKIQETYFTSIENKLFKSRIFQGINKIAFIQMILNRLFDWQISKQ